MLPSLVIPSDGSKVDWPIERWMPDGTANGGSETGRAPAWCATPGPPSGPLPRCAARSGGATVNSRFGLASRRSWCSAASMASGTGGSSHCAADHVARGSGAKAPAPSSRSPAMARAGAASASSAAAVPIAPRIALDCAATPPHDHCAIGQLMWWSIVLADGVRVVRDRHHLVRVNRAEGRSAGLEDGAELLLGQLRAALLAAVASGLQGVFLEVHGGSVPARGRDRSPTRSRRRPSCSAATRRSPRALQRRHPGLIRR